MIKVKYEVYWNDMNKKHKEKSFYNLKEVENWIFGMMKRDYSDDWAMHFPTQEKVNRLNEKGPWEIEFRPERGGASYWIHQMETNEGIIFTDGKYTARQRHWSQRVKEWIDHCEERRTAKPKFIFID